MENTTLISQVFSLFLSKDDLKPVMKSPFVVGEKTYATDAYTLIRCDNDKVDFAFENKYPPLDVESVIPPINTSQLVNLEQVDWSLLMNVDETIPDGEDVECGHCKGEGTCEQSIYYKGKFYDYEYECPVCDSSGYEEEAKHIPTGNKTFPSYANLKFCNTYFNARAFYKLKKVKDLIGGDVELISINSGYKPALFLIGIFEILLMPAVGDDEYIIANIS